MLLLFYIFGGWLSDCNPDLCQTYRHFHAESLGFAKRNPSDINGALLGHAPQSSLLSREVILPSSGPLVSRLWWDYGGKLYGHLYWRVWNYMGYNGIKNRIIVWKLMKYWNCMEDYMGLNIWDYTLTSYPLLTHLHHKSIGSCFMSNHLNPGLNWLKSLKHQTTNQFLPVTLSTPIIWMLQSYK